MVEKPSREVGHVDSSMGRDVDIIHVGAFHGSVCLAFRRNELPGMVSLSRGSRKWAQRHRFEDGFV